jgi:hypothetical protein
MENPVVTKIIEDSRYIDGQTQPIIRLLFVVGRHGPFTAIVPKAEFTAQRAQEEMAKVAREIGLLPMAPTP